MAFVQNFTIAQTPQNPALCIFEDTSTGADAGIISRSITVVNSAGSYVVPTGNVGNSIAWALATNPYTVTLLTQDTAAVVTVDWLDINGDVLYTKTDTYCFAEYNKSFLYYLIQQQAQAYPIIQDTNYWANVGIFWVNIIGAIKAVELADDISGSQASLDRATYMQANAQNYF